jgi:ABC-type iron transport system FetAB permease component
MPPGMMGGMMFAGMDPEDIGSEEEEEILQEFMMAHSEQVGNIK